LYPLLVGLSEAALYGWDMAYSRGGRGEITNVQNVLSKSLYRRENVSDLAVDGIIVSVTR